MAKTSSILSVLLAFSAFAGAQVTVGRSVQQDLHVSSESTNLAATLSVTQVRTTLRTGRIVDANIIGFFDPSTQLFWWGFEWSIGPSAPETVLKEYMDSYRFSVYPDKIACFAADSRTIEVRTSEIRVPSMSAGMSKAIRLLPEELTKFLSGSTLEFERVPIAGAAGQTFFNPQNFGDPPVRLTIAAVNRSDSGWRIEIKNDRGQCKAIILSSDFRAATSAPQ